MKTIPGQRSWTYALAACLAALFSARGDIIHESATLGPTNQQAGTVLASSVYLGSRFSLKTRVQVEAIGGHIYSIDGGSLFGALISLSSPNALPSGSPFDTTPIAVRTFIPPLRSADVIVPLSTLLQPGDYALV